MSKSGFLTKKSYSLFACSIFNYLKFNVMAQLFFEIVLKIVAFVTSFLN